MVRKTQSSASTSATVSTLSFLLPYHKVPSTRPFLKVALLYSLCYVSVVFPKTEYEEADCHADHLFHRLNRGSNDYLNGLSLAAKSFSSLLLVSLSCVLYCC